MKITQAKGEGQSQCRRCKETRKEDFPYCPHCNRITDPGCVESCDFFKMITEEETNVQDN